MSKKRDSFVFYRSFYESIKELPDKQQLEIFQSIVEYGLNNEIPEGVDVVAKAIFTLIKPQLDANTKRYLNGRKGGAPRGNNNASKDEKQPKTTKKQPKNNLEQPKAFEKQPNENVNVNDNVNDNVNENQKGELKEISLSQDSDIILNKENYIPKNDETATSYLHNYWNGTMDEKYARWWTTKNEHGYKLKQLGENEVKSFVERFNNQVVLDNIPFDERKLFARLNNYAMTWLNNSKDKKKKTTITGGYREVGML